MVNASKHSYNGPALFVGRLTLVMTIINTFANSILKTHVGGSRAQCRLRSPELKEVIDDAGILDQCMLVQSQVERTIKLNPKDEFIKVSEGETA